jgi:anti-anti-sigma factor
VTLLRVPVDFWQRASAHQEAIQREFHILMANLAQDSIPHQLAELRAALNVRFAGVGDETWDELRRAAAEGRDEMDLVFSVPSSVAAASRELALMLDRMDQFCREGEDLLSLATPPDLAAFRRWFLAEFTRQIDDGHEPLSWPDYQQASAELEERVSSRGAGGESTAVVFEGDLDLMTAGALRERILASRNEVNPGVLELDLSGVTFIDSVGISLLVTAHKRLRDDGGELRIILPDRLRPVFEISGLVDFLAPWFVATDQTGDG